jgi:hypothetical protein
VDGPCSTTGGIAFKAEILQQRDHLKETEALILKRMLTTWDRKVWIGFSQLRIWSSEHDNEVSGLSGIFGPKKAKVIAYELYNLYPSSNIVRIIKSRTVI